MSLGVQLKLAHQDKRVIQAIANAGLSEPGFDIPDDPVFQNAAAKFVSLAMQDNEIISCVNRSGLSTSEMCCLYIFGVTAQLPNPLILSGGKMLAISLVFIEPLRLRELLEAIGRRISPQMGPSERLVVIASCVNDVTSLIKKVHDSARGAAKMPPSGTGCAIFLIFPIGFLLGFL
jgi:hypothetical protein